MVVEINNALTRTDCVTAIGLAKELFDSKYTDNSIRMLYASALACKAGIKLYDVFNELVSFGGSNPIGQFARIFPSSLSDQKLESGWVSIDVLQSILKPGTVVGAADQIAAGTLNPGSVLPSDRTIDSMVYSLFISMSVIGNTLNRYGAPDTGYKPGTPLPWTSAAAVQADTTGSACGLASAFLGFFDAFDVATSILPSSSAASLNTMTGLIRTPIEGTYDPLLPVGGMNFCMNATASNQPVCDLAKIRLRYRGACTESTALAAFAAGMIASINTAWTNL